MKLETLLGNCAKARVAIIGDVCLDAYIFVSDEKSEISVETGLKTRSVKRFTFDLGGAGNVAINVKRLGAATVDLFGIIGSDSYGDIVRNLLAREGLSSGRLMIQDDDWLTHVYCKFDAPGGEEPCLDFGNFNVPKKESIDGLLGELEANISRYDAVIINEQVISGFQNEYFQDKMNRLIGRHANSPLWICDCRKLNDVYINCIHKLNIREARQIYRANPGGDSVVGVSDAHVVEWLYSRWGLPVIVTREANGAMVFDGRELREIRGLHVIDQIDTVGAGDAFLAAAVACLATGSDLEEAAQVGNLASGVSIQKLYQTGHPSPAEILKIGTFPDYRYNPELSDDPSKAKYLANTEVEIITRPSGDTPRIAIFDHDGTISTLRRGWEEVMTRVMTSCVLGDKYKFERDSVDYAVESAVKNLIDRTTGVQTLLQMRALCKLVADFGYVRDIGTPIEYKTMYDKELLKLVDVRLGRVRKGALGGEDFTIKGSIAFLKHIREAGVSLYLVSGTDVEDVRSEAEALGYAEYFDGGIHGAVGDIDRDPKRMVLENLLGEVGAKSEGACCAVFGDGPVEMREGKKHGAVTIGVASDERQRYGMNTGKRPRLVLGGADVIIPDFSWSDDLVSWLGWEL